MLKTRAILNASTILLATAAAMHASSPLSNLTQTPLTAVASNITYTKGVGTQTTAGVVFKLTAPTTDKGSLYVSVKADTLPNYIQVSTLNGTVSGSGTLTMTFSPSPTASALPPGSQGNQSITINETYYPVTGGTTTGTTAVLVNLTVINSPAQISASLTSGSGFTLAPGGSVGTATLNITSSSDPVSFTVAPTSTSPASPNWILPAKTTGFAYSWGTQITVSFLQSVFDASGTGATLSGSIKITGPNNSVVVPVTFLIGQPVATVSSAVPSKLPQKIAAGSTRVIALAGTGFVPGISVRVGSSTAPNLANDCAGFAAATGEEMCIQSTTELYVKVTAADLAGASGSLHIFVGATPVDKPITVTTDPIVTGMTDAAALALPASNLLVSPYQLVSIFGENFTTGATLIGSVTNSRYPNVLVDGASNLKVHFAKTATALCAGTALSVNADSTDGYLLFATPNQINLLIPSAVAGNATVYACVQYGSASSANQVLTVDDTNPGVFTFGGGTGQGVVVNQDYSINSKTIPATVAGGNTISIYMSGLGIPAAGTTDPAALPTVATGIGTVPTGCADVAKFLAWQVANATGASGWTSLDGSVISLSVLSDPLGSGTVLAYPPCVDPTTVSVTISGSAGTPIVLTPAYVGWVADTVAGLYQINVKVTTVAGVTPLANGGFNITVTETPADSSGAVLSQTGVIAYFK
jgi:uncharacterized protein (TIGR03437 family)